MLETSSCCFDSSLFPSLQGKAFSLVRESVSEITFLNCRPSVIAAAIIYAERRARGIIPFWPSMLSKLTGYQVFARACLRLSCAHLLPPGVSSPY